MGSFWNSFFAKGGIYELKSLPYKCVQPLLLDFSVIKYFRGVDL